MRLAFEKILRLTQAASKDCIKDNDFYASAVWYHHPHCTGVVVLCPRVASPKSQLYPITQDVYGTLGVQPSENGRLAFRPFEMVLLDLIRKDSGRCKMQPLSFFLHGEYKMPIIIQWDATGFGSQQLTTVALNNPCTTKSARELRPFGLGNCSDDRNGTTRLLGPNLKVINDLIMSQCFECEVNGEQLKLPVEVFIVSDLSAVRHCEHVAASGFCGCSRDFALRTVLKKPTTVAEMYSLLKHCHNHTRDERFILSHTPLPGETKPRPCTAAGCKFAHDPTTALAELAELRKEESELEADQSKNGKARYSRWRMKHAHLHMNIQPGKYGAPMFWHDLCNQVLDWLHMAILGLPQTPWKYGVLNNASDRAREQISDWLKKHNHPLDTRRKDNNRVREQMWFNGAKWASFCQGLDGSPGLPVAMAQIVMIVTLDLEERGVDRSAAASIQRRFRRRRSLLRPRLLRLRLRGGKQGAAGQRSMRARPQRRQLLHPRQLLVRELKMRE